MPADGGWSDDRKWPVDYIWIGFRSICESNKGIASSQPFDGIFRSYLCLMLDETTRRWKWSVSIIVEESQLIHVWHSHFTTLCERRKKRAATNYTTDFLFHCCWCYLRYRLAIRDWRNVCYPSRLWRSPRASLTSILEDREHMLLRLYGHYIDSVVDTLKLFYNDVDFKFFDTNKDYVKFLNSGNYWTCFLSHLNRYQRLFIMFLPPSLSAFISW